MEETNQVHVKTISEAVQVTLNMVNNIHVSVEEIPTTGMQLSTIVANLKMIRDAVKQMEEGSSSEAVDPPKEMEESKDDSAESSD